MDFPVLSLVKSVRRKPDHPALFPKSEVSAKYDPNPKRLDPTFDEAKVNRIPQGASRGMYRAGQFAPRGEGNQWGALQVPTLFDHVQEDATPAASSPAVPPVQLGRVKDVASVQTGEHSDLTLHSPPSSVATRKNGGGGKATRFSGPSGQTKMDFNPREENHPSPAAKPAAGEHSTTTTTTGLHAVNWAGDHIPASHLTEQHGHTLAHVPSDESLGRGPHAVEFTDEDKQRLPGWRDHLREPSDEDKEQAAFWAPKPEPEPDFAMDWKGPEGWRSGQSYLGNHTYAHPSGRYGVEYNPDSGKASILEHRYNEATGSYGLHHPHHIGGRSFHGNPDKVVAEIERRLAEEHASDTPSDKPADDFQAKREAHNARADEVLRLQRLGQNAIPGLRLTDAEDTGHLVEMHQQGQLTDEQWQAHVRRMHAEGRVSTEKPAVSTEKPTADTSGVSGSDGESHTPRPPGTWSDRTPFDEPGAAYEPHGFPKLNLKPQSRGEDWVAGGATAADYKVLKRRPRAETVDKMEAIPEDKLLRNRGGRAAETEIRHRKQHGEPTHGALLHRMDIPQEEHDAHIEHHRAERDKWQKRADKADEEWNQERLGDYNKAVMDSARRRRARADDMVGYYDHHIDEHEEQTNGFFSKPLATMTDDELVADHEKHMGRLAGDRKGRGVDHFRAQAINSMRAEMERRGIDWGERGKQMRDESAAATRSKLDEGLGDDLQMQSPGAGGATQTEQAPAPFPNRKLGLQHATEHHPAGPHMDAALAMANMRKGESFRIGGTTFTVKSIGDKQVRFDRSDGGTQAFSPDNEGKSDRFRRDVEGLLAAHYRGDADAGDLVTALNRDPAMQSPGGVPDSGQATNVPKLKLTGATGGGAPTEAATQPAPQAPPAGGAPRLLPNSARDMEELENRLRDKRKWTYVMAMHTALDSGKSIDDVPVPDGLSLMTAQGLRMQVQKIVDNAQGEEDARAALRGGEGINEHQKWLRGLLTQPQDDETGGSWIDVHGRPIHVKPVVQGAKADLFPQHEAVRGHAGTTHEQVRPEDIAGAKAAYEAKHPDWRAHPAVSAELDRQTKQRDDLKGRGGGDAEAPPNVPELKLPSTTQGSGQSGMFDDSELPAPVAPPAPPDKLSLKGGRGPRQHDRMKFKHGDRVQFADGRKGTVIFADGGQWHMGSIYGSHGEQRQRSSEEYHVKTDNGATRRIYLTDGKHSGRPDYSAELAGDPSPDPHATPDIHAPHYIGDEPEHHEPSDFIRMIERSREKADESRGKASRARKQSKRQEHALNAKVHEKQYAEHVRAWNEWASAHPEAAQAVVGDGKPIHIETRQEAPAQPASTASGAGPMLPSGITAQVSRNHAKGGVEIRFSDKPGSIVTAHLKQHGFRWSGKQGVWYAPHNEHRMGVANALAGVSTPSGNAPSDRGGQSDDTGPADPGLASMVEAAEKQWMKGQYRKSFAIPSLSLGMA